MGEVIEFMDSVALLAHDMWRALALTDFEKGVVRATLVGYAIFLIAYVLERAAGTPGPNYRSQGFVHDLAYWFYYRTGVHGWLLFAPVVTVLEAPLSLIALDPPLRMPFVAHQLFILISSDFLAYWIHRAEHRFKFMWAFHTTHHSQEHLTFATIARFHPVEMLYHNILVYIPLRILGVEPSTWIPLFLFNQIYAGLQHTQIPWKLGPFYKIMATPAFHSFHHSTDPAHHDKNFSSVFSLWDHLFGTALPSSESKPTKFGLDGIRPTPLASTLITPFRLLYEFYVIPLRSRGLKKS